MSDILLEIDRLIASDCTLTDEEKTAAIEYAQTVWPQIRMRSAPEPEFLCIAGIPGAGKTAYIRRYNLEDRFVIVDPDHFRKYTPQYSILTSQNVVDSTKSFVDFLSTLIIWIAIYARCPICIPSTFCATDFWSVYLNKLKPYLCDRMYATTLLVLEQPIALSLYSFSMRSSSTSDAEPITRPFDDFFFKDTSLKFKQSLQALMTLGFFSDVSILSRTELNQEYTSADPAWKSETCIQGDD